MIPVILLVLIPLCIAQDIIFPEQQTQTTSVLMQSKIMEDCSINMTVIEEDGESTCECVSGYLYHPPLDRCFKPYTRGPCATGSYYVLRPGKTTAECVINPCEEGLVIYQNSCHRLLRPGSPCNDTQTLSVNEENFEIYCQVVEPVLYQIITAPVKHCQPGSKLIAQGKCRRSL